MRRGRRVASAALADGAGSRELSQHGAEAAVNAALEFFPREFDKLYELCERDIDEARHHIHQRCFAAVQRVSQRRAVPAAALASTLMVFAATDDRYLAIHLGDGVMVQQREGALSVLSTPDNGEYTNTTVFVTDAGAASKLRVYFGGSPPDAVALMSDGSSESLYQRSTARPAAALSHFIEWGRKLRKKQMEAVLAENVRRLVVSKTMDDCAIALLWRLTTG